MGLKILLTNPLPWRQCLCERLRHLFSLQSNPSQAPQWSQLLPVLTQPWKNFSINLVISLPVSIDWKRDSYDSILVIVDWLTKIVHYKPVKITLDRLKLGKVIINVVICHHGLSNSTVTNKSSFFISKFWSLLYYFLGIKWRLFTTFNP